MNASNLSPTFPEGSSPTWTMTSHCRRQGFVHRRLYLCRRGTSLVRHTHFLLVCISDRPHPFTNDLGRCYWPWSHILLFSWNLASIFAKTTLSGWTTSPATLLVWILTTLLTAQSLCSALQLASKVLWMPAPYNFFNVIYSSLMQALFCSEHWGTSG